MDQDLGSTPLPSQYPSYPTCWRRFAKWSLQGIWDIAIERLLQQLDLRHQLDWSEGFVDATFATAKKGGIASATHKRGKGARSWSFRRQWTPAGHRRESASVAEVNLIEKLLDRSIMLRRF